jgi:hypothetical protein
MSTAVTAVPRKTSGVIFNLVDEYRRRAPLIFWVSVGHFILLTLILPIAPFDERLVTGINPWIKPIKFIIANTVYMLTIGWFLRYWPGTDRTRSRVSRLVVMTIIAETALITLQAARGTTSHHNTSTLTNLGILGIMGVMIVINTVVVAYVAHKFWRNKPAIPAAYLWGVRLGLLIFLLASLEGFAMVRLNAHSVGVADGGPGLPLLNWSTMGGDLRIAHFIGLHALQVLPVVGYLFSSPRVAALLKNPSRWVWAIATLYAGLSLLLFLQALSGAPLISR